MKTHTQEKKKEEIKGGWNSGKEAKREVRRERRREGGTTKKQRTEGRKERGKISLDLPVRISSLFFPVDLRVL